MGASQRRLMRHGVLVLAYHKIGQAPSNTRDPFLYESKRSFETQLAALTLNGIRSSSLSQIGSNPVPAAVVTFDDGCLDTLEHGLPVLSKSGYKAIQFLVSEHLGGQNEWDIRKGDVPARLMDRQQVQEWMSAGNDIGSHSKTHRNLRHLSAAEAREEIFGSKRSLEDVFGREIEHFSYPYGSWNSQVRELAMEAGYKTACTMDFGVCGPACHSHELKRVFPLSTMDLLSKAIHRLRRKVKA